MPLSPGWNIVALKLQEASIGLTHGNVRDRLSDAVNELHKDGGYGHYVDHTGDGESGDCVYTSGGEMCSAPYTMGMVNGKAHAAIDHENRTPVVAHVEFHPKAEDSDHYTAMEAAGLYVSGSAALVERFISKGERDKAEPGDFAGKGKSFPILKREDVGAAVHAMGRAGSANYGMSGLKSRIVAIAKKKGWTGHLPKSWQEDDGAAAECMEADLTGDIVPLKEGAVGQDGTAFLKLIAPGRGSSGYYPAEVLERDGPKVFPKGTKCYWNHQTAAEEAARPEGDLRDLASVLTEDAHWEASGPTGPGLYAKTEVQPHYRGPVDSLAKHIGMSIRASGQAKEGVGPDGKRGPIIEKLTRGISVDYVTTPGAGGQILQLFEAAGSRQFRESGGGADDMTEAQLREVSDLKSTVRKLTERLAKPDAENVIRQYFGTVYVSESVKAWVVRHLLERPIPMTATGDVDSEKLTKLAEAATIEACELAGGGRPIGMGAPDAKMTEAQRAEMADRDAKQYDAVMSELAGFVVGEAADGADKKERKKFQRLHEAFKMGRAA